ncbi:GAF domain-containing sensor histidine kinase [Nocardioides sp. J2M5]|uniref:sensor histidine kinase n=1 Tax=Nocardioides palaemonis TaxID=2829810 RepID=UPI001BA46F95|nr:GAF domain-containing sensor histidine kinase [Nocardioides palaemonis]MBS2938366.1 GAF domain-containing sensor histidine kinase [Nocardioides palaemonis]
MSEDGAERGSGEPSLETVDFDRLLREVLSRVEGVLDESERLRHLLDAVVAVSSELSLDAVLSRIVSAASNLLGARYAALGVLTEGPDRSLRTFIHHGMSDEVVARIGALPTGHGLLGLLIEDPRPIRLEDIASHPASYGFPDEHPPMSSFLGVPVRTRDRVFGNLYLTEKTGGGDFTGTDEAIAVALAAAAGVAIENATLYEEAEGRRAWLAATAEIAALLSADTPVGEALQVVADRARSLARADVAWVVTGSTAGELRLEVVSGAPVDLEAMQALPMRSSLASLVIDSGEPVTVLDLGTDPRAVDPSSIAGWPQLGPVIVLPLMSGTQAEGVLSLAWTPEHADGFHRVDPDLPASFAEQAALALQLARSREDRQRLVLYEDRDRIARDLHDLVIQRLFAVGMGLQATAKQPDLDDRVRGRLTDAIDELDDTIKDIRRTIFALGSLGADANLQTEVETLVERAGAVMKLNPKLRLVGPVRSTVPHEVVPDLLAVLGEALTNVARHAHASAVDVVLSAVDGNVVLVVADDGRGMDRRAAASGLENMRVRARRHGGDLQVESEAGAGTTVTWTVPLVAP